MPYTYENLTQLPIREKITHLMRSEKIFHVIFAQQFTRENLDFLCKLATLLRKIAKSTEGMRFLRSLLEHKSALLYFTQPSTRTYLSFLRACQYLGIKDGDARDPSTSSAMKGESDIDGARTFSSYFDLIIMRHHESGFAERVAHLMNEIARPIPIISGGAGADEHPTQALLDIYTLERSFEERENGIDGIHVGFVGDLKRGRTVRSLAQLLTRFDNVKMTFISPDQLRIRDDLRTLLQRENTEFEEAATMDAALAEVDALYVTRIQDEHDVDGESKQIDYSPYKLTMTEVNRMKKDAIIMHPMPRRDEIDPAIDSDPRAMYWRQERNGMWIRAALIAYVFNTEGRILDYYASHHGY
jgi:aspartate carbamoyltransferase catalytic subunit